MVSVLQMCVEYEHSLKGTTMTKFRTAIVLAAAMLTAGIAHAESIRENAREMRNNWREGTSTVRGLVGFNRGELDLGLDYERRMGTMGFGGFALMSGENDHTTPQKPGQLVVGINTPVHLIVHSPFDVYLAPGIAYIKNDDVKAVGLQPAVDSESSFGPSMRVGMLYAVNETWAVGLDFIRATNWSNDDAASDYDFANIGIAYNM